VEEYLAQGDQLLAQGQPAKAVASYRLALHQDTLNPVVLARLAKAYQAQRKPVAADSYLRRAMDITYEKGLSALRAGDDSAAVAAFEQTLGLFPRHALALSRLGDIYRAREEEEKALYHYEKAAEANPGFAQTFVVLGQLYAARGALDQAQRAFQRAIELNINALQAYLGLGQLHLDAGRWTEAAELFDKALLIDPYSSLAQTGLDKAQRHP
jgi:tetratricopeptide (TPR) repeat protein